MKRCNDVIYRDGPRTTIGLRTFAVGTRFDMMAARLTAAEG